MLPYRNNRGEVDFKKIGEVQTTDQVLAVLLVQQQDGNYDWSPDYVANRRYQFPNPSKTEAPDDYGLSSLACWSNVTKSYPHSDQDQRLEGVRLTFQTSSGSPFSITFTPNHPILEATKNAQNELTGVFRSAGSMTVNMSTLGVMPSEPIRIIDREDVSIESCSAINIEVGDSHDYFVGPDLDELVLMHNVIT